MASCVLHKYHAPEPMSLHLHHVIPESWTEKAGQPQSRRVLVCPTGHANIHHVLNDFLVYHKEPPRLSKAMLRIVTEALAWYASHPVPSPRTSEHM